MGTAQGIRYPKKPAPNVAALNDALAKPGSIGERPMKIALLTLGTRGDAQPFIALGKALNGGGHADN